MPLTPMTTIIGATDSKTLNTLVLDSSQTSHVRCGADILLTGMYHDLRGEATCPVCGAKIDVAIEARKVVSVRPQSALLHYVVEDDSRFSICCASTLLFDREQCLEVWLRSYGGTPGVVTPLQGFMSEAISRRGDR